MAASPYKIPSASELAYWPFSYLSLCSQMARDFGRYTQAMTQCTDAMEAAHAEADFGARLFADMTRGYVELALAPWAAMARVMAERAEDVPAATLAPLTKARGRAH